MVICPKPFKMFQNTVQRTPTRMRHVACVHSSDDASRVKPRTRRRLGTRAPSRAIRASTTSTSWARDCGRALALEICRISPKWVKMIQNVSKCEQCAFNVHSSAFMPIHAHMRVIVMCHVKQRSTCLRRRSGAGRSHHSVSWHLRIGWQVLYLNAQRGCVAGSSWKMFPSLLIWYLSWIILSAEG